MSEQVEYIRIAMAFLGALFGAAIGGPLIEWTKDKLGAQRQWLTRRQEIISTLRYLLGTLRAFDEIRSEAFPKGTHTVSRTALSRLSSFSFVDFHRLVEKLSSLHPTDLEKSAAGQRLVQHLISFHLILQQVKDFKPITASIYPNNEPILVLSDEDQDLLKKSDEKYIDLQQFIIGIYSSRLGVNGMTLTIDPEIIKYENDLGKYKLEKSIGEFRKQYDNYKENLANNK